MKEYKFKVSGKDYTVSVDNVEENIVDVVVNGTSHKVELEKAPEAPAPVARPVVQRPTETATPAAPAATGGSGKPLKSPLPGVIIDVFVRKGDVVKNGQKVLLLEAMKMENNIDSDRDGTILDIKIAKGDNVNEGDTLIIIG
jgi:biotin carboxyl carrier protein